MSSCVTYGMQTRPMTFRLMAWLLESPTWWRHQMETFSALLTICAGNSPVTGDYTPHKGQWRGALMFSLIGAWINGWVRNREAGDLRRPLRHLKMSSAKWWPFCPGESELREIFFRQTLYSSYYLLGEEYTAHPKTQITSIPTVYSNVYSSTDQAQIKENIKAPRHWPLWGQFTGDRRMPRTKGQ